MEIVLYAVGGFFALLTFIIMVIGLWTLAVTAAMFRASQRRRVRR